MFKSTAVQIRGTSTIVKFKSHHLRFEVNQKILLYRHYVVGGIIPIVDTT